MRRTGTAAIERLHSDGTLENLRRFSDFSRNWTHIVGVSGGLLFFYKSHNGEGTVLRVNSDGTITTQQAYPENSFAQGWTQIATTEGNLILFYKAAQANGAVLKLKQDGTLATLHTYPDGSFGKDWSHIVAAHGNVQIYYSNYSGTAAIAKLQDNGTVVTLRNYDDPAEYKCSGVLQVVVDFSTGQQHTYVINPDRANVMAYYLQLSCPKPFHFSPDQIHVIRHALQHPNRRHLVEPYEFVIKDCPGCQ